MAEQADDLARLRPPERPEPSRDDALLSRAREHAMEASRLLRQWEGKGENPYPSYAALAHAHAAAASALVAVYRAEPLSAAPAADEKPRRSFPMDEPCTVCPHTWGAHSSTPPHACHQCRCPMFTTPPKLPTTGDSEQASGDHEAGT